jgi:tetratricopeptide (TPR) repeat protein
LAAKAKAASPKDLAPSDAGLTADGSPAPGKLKEGAPTSRLRIAWSQRAPDMPVSRHRTAFDRGHRLALFEQYEKALSAFREAAKQKPDFAEAHLNIGWILSETGRSEEAFAVYDELVARFGTATELSLREQVAKAIYSKGVSLDELGRSEDAITVYDELLTRFGDAAFAASSIAGALVNKGSACGALGRSEDAIAAYDELLTRFGAATELSLRELVAAGLNNKGNTLSRFNRNVEAIAAYDEVLARFGTSDEPPLRESVAVALHNKGLILRQNPDLVSHETVQNGLVPGATTTPAGEPGQPRSRSALPVPEAGHELTRSAQTPAVEWPAAGWQELRGQRGAKKMHAIVDYLRVKWKPFLDATGAAVTLEILDQKDPGAGTALRRYLERHPMPEGLRFVPHDEVMNILAERPTRLVDVASCHRCYPGMQ